MAEQLGEALLVLRTDDQGLDRGIDNAKVKSEGLGRTLDATSGSAANLGKALDTAGTSATRFGETQNNVAKMSGAQRAGIQQLTMNLGDMSTMYSMGMRPAQIFSSQIGQITQAIQLSVGQTSKFATFLGGPWGIALTVAAQVGAPLIAMLLNSDDAAKKAGKGAETFADSLDRQKHSLREVIAAIRDYNTESAKARESALDNAIAAAASADAALKEAMAERAKLAAKLEGARVTAQANAGQGTGGAAGHVAQSQLSATEQQIKANEAEIAKLQAAQADARANFADELSKVAADPTLAVKRLFEQRRENARETIKDVNKLTEALTTLRKQEEAALDKVRKQNRSSSSTRSTASADANVGDMTALIEQLFPGARVTSTTGGKHTKGSDHYAGRAIDFVPKGGMGSISTAEVERILEEAGVTIRRNRSGTKQLFGPGRSAAKPGDHNDHFHVAWEGSASPEEASKRAQQAAEREARAREKEAQRIERYTRDLGGLQDAAADLQARMADTAEERFQLESQGLEIAIAEQKRRIEADADYTAAEKAKLLAALEVKATLERELLAKRKQEELARQQLEIAQAIWSNEREVLEKQAALSEVREERRAIEQRILDESYKQLKAALEATVASQSATEAQKAEARDRLARLPQNRALDQERLNRDYESPLERYRRELNGVGKNMNDELEKVAVNGLERLSDGLADVVMRTRSLGDAFKQVGKEIVAEILRIYIRQKLIMPLLGLMGVGGGEAAAGGAGAAASGIVAGDSPWPNMQGAGFPTSAGGGLGGVLGSLASSALGSIFKGFFADGGLIPNGGFGIVGEAGPEPVFATSRGVGVLPNSALRMANGGGAQRDRVEVEIVDTTGLFETRVSRISQSHVQSGIAGYDRVVGDRVKEHLERRG